ncbi:MAG: 8-oxo-dGTP diphosphatase MutT [Lachnospiraceae bacterium]|nr:8-oxo-dGTP diphosphatase MutT [Lachnospiraceae bacterium]
MDGAKKQVRVAAAVIRKGDEVFATQRGYGPYKDWWEFPGGKIESGETPEDALVREIREELDMTVQTGSFITTVEYDYPEFHLSMDCYWCRISEGEPKLVEHEAARWLPLSDLDQVKWLPADVLVVQKIANGGMENA